MTTIYFPRVVPLLLLLLLSLVTTTKCFVPTTKSHHNKHGRFTVNKDDTLTRPSKRMTTVTSSKVAGVSNVHRHHMIAPQQLGSFEVLDPTEIPNPEQRKVILIDLVRPTKTDSTNDDTTSSSSSSSSPQIDFQTAWDWQKSILEQHVDRLTSSKSASKNDEPRSGEEGGAKDGIGSQFLPSEDGIIIDGSAAIKGIDTVIMLQHSPVYTLGTGSDEKFIIPSSSASSEKEHSRAVPVVRMDRGGEVSNQKQNKKRNYRTRGAVTGRQRGCVCCSVQLMLARLVDHSLTFLLLLFTTCCCR